MYAIILRCVITYHGVRDKTLNIENKVIFDPILRGNRQFPTSLTLFSRNNDKKNTIKISKEIYYNINKTKIGYRTDYLYIVTFNNCF